MLEEDKLVDAGADEVPYGADIVLSVEIVVVKETVLVLSPPPEDGSDVDWLVIEALDTVGIPEEEIRLEDRCVNDRVLFTVTVIHPETVSNVVTNLEEKAEGFTIVVTAVSHTVVVSTTRSVEWPSVTVSV